MNPVNRWAAFVGLGLGGVLSVLAGYEQFTSDRTETRVSVSFPIHAEFDGTRIEFEQAYLDDTDLEAVQEDCRGEILPAPPEDRADGSIEENIVRLEVGGRRVCIVQGQSATIEDGDLTISVLGVSWTNVDDQHFTSLALSEASDADEYFLQAASALILGIGAGALVPAISEWWVRKQPHSSP